MNTRSFPIFAGLFLLLGACADPVATFDLAHGQALLDAATCGSGTTTCPEAPYPGFELPDFQPQSDRFEETYGLAAFEGKPTLLVLLAGW